MIKKFSEDQSLAISNIRALSVMMIVNCHILQAIDNRWAWVLNVGVQIFFCMSGFLHAGKYKNNYWTFVLAKVERVYVPYIIYFTLVLLIYLLFRRDLVTTRNLLGHISALQAFTGTLEGLGHLWFITIILLCYLLTPVAEKLYGKYGLCFWCAVALISFIWFWKISLYYNYCLWILVYFIGYFSRTYIKKLGFFLIILSLVLIAILPSYHIHSGNHFDSWMHAIGGVWIFLSIYYFNQYFNKLRSFVWLKYVDNYSYEIYLTHHLFIQSPFDFLKMTKYFTVNLIIITLAIAASSYFLRIISQKLLNNKIFYPTNRSTGLAKARR